MAFRYIFSFSKLPSRTISLLIVGPTQLHQYIGEMKGRERNCERQLMSGTCADCAHCLIPGISLLFSSRRSSPSWTSNSRRLCSSSTTYLSSSSVYLTVGFLFVLPIILNSLCLPQFGTLFVITAAAAHARDGDATSVAPASNNEVSQILQQKCVFLVANEPVLDSLRVLPLLDSLQKKGGISPERIVMLDEILLRTPSAREWVLLPWLVDTYNAFPKEIEWFIFTTASTRVDPPKLEQVLKKYSVPSTEDGELKGQILGVVLQDEESMITHHYYRDAKFGYPLFSSGVAFDRRAVQRIAKMYNSPPEPSINIDPRHEMFRLFQDRLNLYMTDVSEFCIDLHDLNPAVHTVSSRGPPEYCATWSDTPDTFKAASPKKVKASDVIIAVKTTEKNHEKRVVPLQELWASKAKLPRGMELIFLSDSEDVELGIINLGVENAGSGHCEKFHAIMKYVYERHADRSFVFIADDDTMLNAHALLEVLDWTLNPPTPVMHSSSIPGPLKAYPPNAQKLSPLYMGDRYGYGHMSIKYGYDYITGGGGTVMDREALRIVLEECGMCRCKRPNEPDDMAVGRWMRYMGIRAVHMEGFHQAMPSDYHLHVIAKQKIVSFHRFHYFPDFTKDYFKSYLTQQSSNEVGGSNPPSEVIWDEL